VKKENRIGKKINLTKKPELQAETGNKRK